MAGVSMLACVGGWIDAESYLRFDTFAGAMTGNSVLLGVAVLHRSVADALYHLTIIAAFLTAIVVARLGRMAGISRRTLLWIAALLIASTRVIQGHWLVAALALAMGCQNAAVRRVGGVAVNTVFISGDLVSLGEALSHPGSPDRTLTLWTMATIWISYVGGAVLGALTVNAVIAGALGPAAVLLACSGILPVNEAPQAPAKS